ncbi:MAG: helix-turn-helix domain-containing protein [Halodesulfurarchaeum sp.]
MLKNKEKCQVGVIIRAKPSETCPLMQLEGEPAYIRSQMLGDTCLVEAILNRSETVIEKSRKTIDSDCLCLVFQEHNCVADVTAVEKNAITITTHLADPTEIKALIDDLRRITDTIEIIDIANHTDGNLWADFEEVDVSSVTEKQWVAGKLAVERGYFKQPRETTIEELAAELGISQQAFSRRLTVVKEKLLTQLF